MGVSAAALIAITVVFLATMGSVALVYWAGWQGFRDQWRRLPPERRGRGLMAGVATFVGIVIATALSIAEPWGPDSVLYVIGVAFGSVAVISMLGVFVQARRDVLRARRHRAGHPHPKTLIERIPPSTQQQRRGRRRDRP